MPGDSNDRLDRVRQAIGERGVLGDQPPAVGACLELGLSDGEQPAGTKGQIAATARSLAILWPSVGYPVARPLYRCRAWPFRSRSRVPPVEAYCQPRPQQPRAGNTREFSLQPAKRLCLEHRLVESAVSRACSGSRCAAPLAFSARRRPALAASEIVRRRWWRIAAPLQRVAQQRVRLRGRLVPAQNGGGDIGEIGGQAVDTAPIAASDFGDRHRLTVLRGLLRARRSFQPTATKPRQRLRYSAEPGQQQPADRLLRQLHRADGLWQSPSVVSSSVWRMNTSATNPAAAARTANKLISPKARSSRPRKPVGKRKSSLIITIWRRDVCPCLPVSLNQTVRLF